MVGDDDPPRRTVRDATTLIGEALSCDASAIAVPVEFLDPAFFDLATGYAGELLQKAANYRLVLAVIGDVTPYAEHSRAFHDLVVESARATGYCFVPAFDDLPGRLARMRA